LIDRNGCRRLPARLQGLSVALETAGRHVRFDRDQPLSKAGGKMYSSPWP